jgi:2,4-dienoyl-CoA reductase-like NADH-dependent reductase (Old Yellow Enzyme family)
LIVGTRISSNEYDVDGFGDDDTLPICRELRETFDYFNVIAGTSASSSGAVHIAPPMTVKNAYIAPFAQKLRQAIGKPVFVAGRINQPHQAEGPPQVRLRHVAAPDHLRPLMPAKARTGVDDIRACIGCTRQQDMLNSDFRSPAFNI